jgi:hypothetical protein
VRSRRAVDQPVPGRRRRRDRGVAHGGELRSGPHGVCWWQRSCT